MSKSKAKGTAFETEIVRTLQSKWWPHASRRALTGALDTGDINVHPEVVIEAKDHGTLKFSQWLAEAEKERVNAGASIGVVWAKRRGKASASDAYVVMDGDTFMSLLNAAGY